VVQEITHANFVLLQWLVVEGFQRCNLKLLFRQTRLCAPDSAPLQAIQFRYAQFKGLRLNKATTFQD
jgi:hypothetical protein